MNGVIDGARAAAAKNGRDDVPPDPDAWGDGGSVHECIDCRRDPVGDGIGALGGSQQLRDPVGHCRIGSGDLFEAPCAPLRIEIPQLVK